MGVKLDRRSGIRPALMALAVIVPAVVAARAAAQEHKPYTMGYAVGFLSTPFLAIGVDQTYAAAKTMGLKTVPVANANGDAGKQIADIHNLIAEGATGIILVATDSDAIVPALNYAESKHVPIVSTDIGPSGGHTAMIVRADNLRMGADACALIGKKLGGKGTLLSMMGDQATINGRDRTTGFNDCMKANYPGIKVVQQPTYWKSDKATAVAQTVVTSTPDLAAIYMQSDSVMLAGVINVLKSAGKLTKVGDASH